MNLDRALLPNSNPFSFFADSRTVREHGRKAQLGNIAAAKSVADIVRTTLGPRSMLKMILDPMGGIVLTNDGNAILREVRRFFVVFDWTNTLSDVPCYLLPVGPPALFDDGSIHSSDILCSFFFFCAIRWRLTCARARPCAAWRGIHWGLFPSTPRRCRLPACLPGPCRKRN